MKSLTLELVCRGDYRDQSLKMDVISTHLKPQPFLQITEYAPGQWKIRHSGDKFANIESIKFDFDGDDHPVMIVRYVGTEHEFQVPVSMLVEPAARAGYIYLDKTPFRNWRMSISDKLLDSPRMLKEINFIRE